LADRPSVGDAVDAVASSGASAFYGPLAAAMERIVGLAATALRAPFAFILLTGDDRRCFAAGPQMPDGTSHDTGALWRSGIVERIRSGTVEMRDVIRGLIEKEARLDYAAVLIPTNARSFVHVTLVIFDTKNEAETKRAYDTAKLLVREAAKHGYGEYRAHLDFMDLAAEQYSFNDHAYMRFVETIKDAVDPNGILAPGKQGIWPRAMRETRGG